MKNQVNVGVGVIVYKNNQILLGKRIGAHGEGTWGYAGGHLEFGETPFDCAVREVKEETGLEITNLKVGLWINNYFSGVEKQYVTIFVKAESLGEPKIMEPNKCLEWKWFDKNNLPENLFDPIKDLIKIKEFKF